MAGLVSMRRKGGAYTALVLIILTVAYGLFQARTLIQGPVLVVSYPTPGATLEGQTFTLRGNAQNISRVKINGRAVTTNLEGDFEEVLVTPNGFGILLVEAENRLGRYTSERMEVYGKPSGDENDKM